MKNKMTKAFLLALIMLIVFSSFTSVAYESYDTYTYSIDGEALPSPHAYTPDVETYDSTDMGLLAGYYWCYSDGKVALWTGEMTAQSVGISHSSEGLEFSLDDDGAGYTVTGFSKEFKASLEDSSVTFINLLIPAFYDGLPVKAVAPSAFKRADESESNIYRKISSIILGKNVVEIGSEAFADANKLASVYSEADSDEWNNVVVGDGNKSFTSAKLYHFSEDVKFGNTKLSSSTDIIADYEGNIYIADTGNNRIVVLNKYDYKTIGVIKTYTDEYGKTQTFNGPTGVYVTDPTIMVDGSQEIFVCDTNNKRIVVFDTNYQYVRTIEEPKNALLEENDFTPYAMAVDIYGRIFVVSRNCSKGIIVLSGSGEFTGFIGAQKVTTSPLEQIWEKFQSAEDRISGSRNLSIPFNNITVDADGFVYVTISFTESDDLSQQLASIKSKSSTYSPVKKLNSRGVEIMKRNGFFDPGGEVVSGIGVTYNDVSTIIDVSLGAEGSWTILDSSRSRLYTYDQNGNLLFAFGDKGAQVGNGVSYVAMTYQVVDGVYNLVLLDDTKTTGLRLTVYHPTEYCDTIMEALHNQNTHNYSATIDNWQQILTSNNNFDLAYIGIGKALYNQGEYEEAMKMLSSAYETNYYSKAFAEIRKAGISNMMIPMVLALILVIVAISKFLGWAKKKNKATSLKVGRKTYGEEMLYVFHIIFHPFDGFWDLKHEKRGSVRAAATILGITVLAFFYQGVGRGYMFNTRGTSTTILAQLLSVVVPVALWVVGNWCLTTLFDGEGSMKDIFVASCYALAPLPVFVVVSTILTNVLTVSEGSIVNLLVTFGYIWVGILLFFGMAVTHDYSMGKNFITILGTIVAMCVIMFIMILFSSLVMKMATFLISIVGEVINRFA